jgi:hypothetical protein
MVILMWIAVVIVAANVLFGAVLLVRYRAEAQRAAEARDRRQREPHWGAG